MLEPTQHFGFTRVGQGETLAKNGHAALDSDRSMLDTILHAMMNHRHEGGTQLDGPGTPPSATAYADDPDGKLPGGRTYYYRYSFLDVNGLETAASPEVEVSTAPGSGRPQAPTLTHEAAGGSLNAGRYSYKITFMDLSGGESTASEAATISFTATECSGSCRIRLDLPEAPTNAPCINIYRAKQGQTRYFLLDKIEDLTSYYDDGSKTEDQSITPPTMNTTSGSNRVEVEIDAIPDGVVAWRLYRTSESGSYGNASLVHQVVEPTTESGVDLRTAWSDLGGMLSLGTPKSRSSSLPGSLPLRLDQLEGTFSIANLPRGGNSWDLFLPGTLMAKTYGRATFPLDVRPLSMSAFFVDPPEGVATSVRFVASDGTHEVPIELTSDADYINVRFPMTEQGFFEAESGGRASGVPIVNDLDASGSQAVELSMATQFSLVETEPLDAGEYQAHVNLRRRTDTPAITDDVRLSVIRVSDDAPLFQQTVTVNNTAYQEYPLGPFEVEQGEAVYLRVQKLEESTIVFYLVDYFRFEAVLETLEAGEIDLRVEVDGFTSLPAENGTRSGTTAVVADADALTGEAVELTSENSYVQMTYPTPPATLMSARVRVRTQGGAAPTDGLSLQARRGDTQGVLTQVLASPDSDEYAWFEFEDFTPPVGIASVLLRVVKVVNDPEDYVIDMVETSVSGMHPGGDVQFRMNY